MPIYSTIKTAMPRDIFDYDNFRLFLKERFLGLQAQNPAFSQRRLARDSKIANPGFFNEVLKGRRELSPASAKKLAVGLRLTGEETEYFLALVFWSRCTEAVPKRLAEQNLIRLRKERVNTYSAPAPDMEKSAGILQELERSWSIVTAHFTVPVQVRGKGFPIPYSGDIRSWRPCLNGLRDLRELMERSATVVAGLEGQVFQVSLVVRPNACGNASPSE